jgi:uncharacterized membrane protein
MLKLIWTNRVIFILSIVGLVISGYLFYTYATDAPIVCASTGCETVRDSPYAYFLGIPLPFFGGLMYMGIFVLSFAKTMLPKKLASKVIKLIFLLSLVGVLISAYLTYLELYVIHAVCMWCVSQAVVIFLIFLISSYEIRLIRYES